MRTNVTISLDHDLRIRFKEYCIENKVSQAGVIESLIIDYLKNKSQASTCENTAGNDHSRSEQ